MLEWCRRAAPCALFAVATVWACEEDETRPGFARDCNEPECLDARGDSFPLPLPTSPGDDGNGGAAGGGMTGASGEIAGSVQEVSSLDFGSAVNLQEAVDVRAENANGGEDVVVQPAVGGAYRLEGMVRGAVVWVGVGNFEDPPIEPFMDTLQAVDSRGVGVTDLRVVRTDMMRDLASSSFLNQTVELSLDRAHLIVRFVDTDKQPVAGVEITFPSPQNVSIAYDAGEIYSDALPETSSRGMAVLLNLEAPAWPGSPLAIVADFEGDRLSAQVQLARGAVTVVDAVVPDP